MRGNAEGEELYWKSFERNIGILTKEDQKRLKDCRIAIAGAGGVGGIYMATLARIGVGKFVVSDPDSFDHSNINRQYGATVDTVGRNKASVMKEIAQAINPSVEVRVLEEGLTAGNTEDFLEGCDLALDSLDVYTFLEMVKLYQTARRKRLFVLKAIPLGFGATLLVFSPTGMSFFEYFGIEDPDNIDVAEILGDRKKTKRFYEAFLNGYSPSKFYKGYLDADVFNPFGETGELTFKPFPSFCPSVHLCSDLATTEAVFLYLGKRPPVVVPKCIQLDLHERVLQISDSG
jgi:molybdopterin/thiamine biosynthesis adenylyltransferase